MNIPKQKPKGLLYPKYHNTISKLRKHELWPKKSNLKTNVTSCTSVDLEQTSLSFEIEGS